MNRSSNSKYAHAIEQRANRHDPNKQRVSFVKRTGRRFSTGSKFGPALVSSSSYSRHGASLHHSPVIKKKFYDTRAASPLTISTASMSSHSSIEEPAFFAPSSDVSPWMRDSSLATTAVFRRRFHQPAVRIQSAVRGLIQRRKYYKLCVSIVRQQIENIKYGAATRIQARVRGNQARDFIVTHRAALSIQSFARSCLTRIKTRASYLEDELYRIRISHRRELAVIERNKQHEMKRIYKELTEEAAAKERALNEAVAKLASKITHLRDDNAMLRDQNKTLRKATRILAQKNARTIQLTDRINENVLELHETASRLESDNKQIKLVLVECENRVNQFKNAVSRVNERIETEETISERYVETINDALNHIHNVCIDKELSVGLIREAQNSLGLRDGSTSTPTV